MSFTNDTLLQDIPQSITGEKTFVGDLWAKNLFTHVINNISMDDIVLVNGDQTIPATKVFTDVDVYGDLNVESLESRVINGVDMLDIYVNSLQYEKPQIMTGRLNVQSITIPKGTNFETNLVNGVNLKHLLADAVLKDVPQTIIGAKTFTAPVTVERTHFTHTFDNVTDHELKHEWLLQDVPQTITGNVVFDQKVEVEDNLLMTVPVINNINLNLLASSTVKIDEPAVISGETRFVQPLISEGISQNILMPNLHSVCHYLRTYPSERKSTGNRFGQRGGHSGQRPRNQRSHTFQQRFQCRRKSLGQWNC